MKEDKSEVVATSNDLKSVDQNIIIIGEENYALIHSAKKVNPCSLLQN